MKRRLSAVLAGLLLFLFLLAGCDAPGVYRLDDVLPPLIDEKTQYPYLERIAVTQVSSGETRELTEPDDLDRLRMQLEGVKSVREEDTGAQDFLYHVTFCTTDGELTLSIVSDKAYVMDGYRYEILRAGIDLFYFDSLFAG